MMMMAGASTLIYHRTVKASSRQPDGPINRSHRQPKLSTGMSRSDSIGISTTTSADNTLYVEALKIDTVSIALSLSRPRHSRPDEVYVGLKLNKMLVDMMYRLDEAHLSLHPLVIVHMEASPGQVSSSGGNGSSRSSNSNYCGRCCSQHVCLPQN